MLLVFSLSLRSNVASPSRRNRAALLLTEVLWPTTKEVAQVDGGVTFVVFEDKVRVEPLL